MRFNAFVILLFSCTALKAQVKFNGNMEQSDSTGNPVGWDLTFDHSNTFDIKPDSLIKKQGKYSVSISSGNSKADYGAINFPIHSGFHGTTLFLSGFIKTENVTGGWAGLWLRVDGTDYQVLGFDNMQSRGITGTNDWKQYWVQIPYKNKSDEALTINAGALLVGKGKIWVDSLRLYLDGIPIDQVPVSVLDYGALKDTSFAKTSGVDTIITNSQNIKYLTLLGELWGFLKYHHPAIANGDYNWDAQLFRILPLVLKCRKDKDVSDVMEKWVDGLGRPKPCLSCKPVAQDSGLVIKPDYGHLFNNRVFNKTLISKLKYIVANSNNSRNYYISIDDGQDNPSFNHEKGYNRIKYPDAGYRLLALYRYWNIIQYFCPNRKLITENWNKILPAYIPQILRADNKNSYVNTLVKLVSTIHDSHSFINSDVYNSYLGIYKLPFQGRFIEDKLVVTGYYSDTLQVKENLKIGDIITSINGMATQALIKKYLPVTSASNIRTALRDMPGIYLLRSDTPLFKLEIIRNNKPLSVTQLGVENSKIDTYEWKPDPKATGYHLINDQIGYVFCAKYKNEDLDSIKNMFKNTKGMIVDMRNYPSDEMENTFGNYFKPDTSGFVKFTRGSVRHPGSFVYLPVIKNGSKSGDSYKGKVVVMVNATTQSNAEFVTMAFQSAPNVTVIGSTTAGADGTISEIPLPGGFTTFISGLGTYYPDGTNTQRTGVKINYVIKPTIQGIKDGRDELLEKAEQLIVGENQGQSPQ
jgi:C-terminal processing protease CtpA/Prc